MKIRRFNENKEEKTTYQKLIECPDLKIEDLRNILLEYNDNIDISFTYGLNIDRNENENCKVKDIIKVEESNIPQSLLSIPDNLFESYKIKDRDKIRIENYVNLTTSMAMTKLKKEYPIFWFDIHPYTWNEHFKYDDITQILTPITEDGEQLMDRVKNLYPNISDIIEVENCFCIGIQLDFKDPASQSIVNCFA